MENVFDFIRAAAPWVAMGLLLAIFAVRSATKKKKGQEQDGDYGTEGMCLGMLLTYYVVAALSHGVYSMEFIIGWTVFALCSPVMAYFAWLTKKQGIFPKIVSVGIIAVSILSSIALFDRPRIYDLLIDGILVYFLFFKKINR